MQSSMSCQLEFNYHFSNLSVLWRCWQGGRKGIRPVKNWVVRCWCGYLSGTRCRLAYSPADAMPLTVSCFSKIQFGFAFLVPAHLGIPGKRAVKRVCRRVCVSNLKNQLSVRKKIWLYIQSHKYQYCLSTAVQLRHDTIRDAILTCARKPT